MVNKKSTLLIQVLEWQPSKFSYAKKELQKGKIKRFVVGTTSVVT